MGNIDNNIKSESKNVYTIFHRATGRRTGVYSRANNNIFEFSSPEDARNANICGAHKDKNEYRIAKYKVTYTLIDDDCDSDNIFIKGI